MEKYAECVSTSEVSIQIVVKDKCFKLTYNEDYVVMATVGVTHK